MLDRKKTKLATLISVALSCGLLLAACSSADNAQSRMARASAHLDSGELRSAEIELKNVLQSQPENAQAWQTLGRVSLAAGRYADAAEQFRRARQNAGQNASENGASQQVELLLARALIGEGDFQDALDVLEPETAADTGAKAEALALQGSAYIGLDESEQAEQAFAAALSARADFPAALVGQAQLARAAGNEVRAEEALTQAVASDPSYGPAWAAKGNLAFRQRRCADVIEAFGRIQALDAGALPPARIFLARAHAAHCQLQEGQGDEATASIDVLMQQSPKHPYANYLQAMVAYEREDYDKATDYLQTVLAAAPDDPPSLMLLGSVKAAQDDLASAEFYLAEAVSQAPASLRARELLATVYVRQDRAGQAVDVLQKALAGQESDPRLLAMLADAAVRSGDQAAGLAYLKQSAEYAVDNPDMQMALARRIAQAGDTGSALALLDQMDASSGDGKLKVAVLKIVMYLREGQTGEAIARAETLAQQHPEDPRVLRILARTYVAADRAPDARAALERAVQADPESPGASLELGLLALRNGDHQAADRIFQGVLDDHPQNFDAMVAMAQRAALQEDSEQTLVWLKRARTAQPDNIDVRVALVRSYLAQGNTAEALPITEELVADAPGNANFHRLNGIALFAAGKGEDALTSLESAASLAPGQPAFALDLAQALLAQGDTDAAMRVLESIRSDHPGYSPGAALLAMAQLDQGQAEAALATAKSLRAASANPAASYELTGNLMREQGDYQAAARAYASAYESEPGRRLALRIFETRRRADLPEPEKALVAWSRQHPDDIAIMAALAEWYQAAGALEAAAGRYRALLDVDPDNIAALNNLALVYQEQGDPKALEAAERAHEAAPRHPAVLDTLGWILVNDGHLERGLPLIRQAAEAATSAPEIQYHLAAALAQRNDQADTADARTILEKLLASDQPFASRAEAEKTLERIAE